MNKRQKKKIFKKALRLSLFSIELADRYLASHGFPKPKEILNFYSKVRNSYDRTTTKAL